MYTLSQKLFVRAIMVLLVTLVSVTAKATTKSWALWCASNKTLYFVRNNTDYTKTKKIKDHPIKAAWKIADKADKNKKASEKKAQWVSDVQGTCTKVVFDKSFSSARPLSCKDWFKGFLQLRSISGIKYLNTAEVTSMSHMFYNCQALKSINVSGFHTGNVKDMSSMFDNCTALKSLDLSKFYTKNVTDMSSMFGNCTNLKTLDVSGFDTQKVTNMKNMFSGCSNLTTLDLSGFSTRKLKSNKMDRMFAGCSELNSIFVDPDKWKVKTNQSNMFDNCKSLVGEDGTTLALVLENDEDEYNSKKLARVKGGLLRCGVGFLLIGPEDYIEFVVNNEYKSTAKEGDDVVVEVYVPGGNTLANMTAKCGETIVELTYLGTGEWDNEYSFTMPAGPVEVTPVFSQLYTLTGENITFKVGEETVTQVMAGKTVNFSLTIPTGKEVNEITVKQGTTPVEFTDYEDGTGDFIMPAGNVTMTVTFKDIPPLSQFFTLTGENNITFFVDKKKVTSAWNTEKVTVEVEAPVGKALDKLTVMQGETPIATALDEDGNHFFTMPAGNVTVTATYMDPFNLESGTLVNAETGERENDYVDFYNELYNTITKAFRGEKVYLDVDPLAIDGGKYFAGEYAGTYMVGDAKQTVEILKDGINSYFIMPNHDVTVTAVLEDQETLEINLTSGAPINLSKVVKKGIELGELTSLMMQWEGYLSHTVKILTSGEDKFPQYLRYFYDFNGDGTDDAVMTRTITKLDGESTYEMQRLDGYEALGANYCAMLKSPGYPMKYKDVLMNFGKSETIYGVFLYDGLENRNTLLTYDGKTVDVGFPDRLLYRDGDWNTICLPFDLTVAGSPLDGAGVTVKTLKGASLDDEGTLTLTFTEGSETEIKAGVPYLIKWDKPAEYKPYSHEPGAVYDDLYGPFFRNVTLKNELNPVDIDELISFIGTYTTWEYTADEPSVLLVGSDSKLFYPKRKEGNYGVVEYATLSPFRAYFQLLGGIEAIDPELGGSIKAMVIDLGDETTEIEELKNSRIEELNSDVWYTLQGVPLQGKPSEKGIYICNGRKVAVQ